MIEKPIMNSMLSQKHFIIDYLSDRNQPLSALYCKTQDKTVLFAIVKLTYDKNYDYYMHKNIDECC